MDDIRRPHSQRRDFAMRHRAHQPPANNISHQTPSPPPAPTPPHLYHHEQLPYNPTPHHAQHSPATHQPAHHYQAPAEPEYQHYSRPVQQPRPAAAAKKLPVPKIPLKYPVIAAVAILLVVAGYSLKPSAVQKTIPPTITKQADFTVYFPAPMPRGYTYMKDTATFQIGDVFYKFNNGRKRVTVKEEATPSPAPNLNLYTGYNQYDVPIGKAVIGKSFGEPVAIVLTTHTVITLNGIGGVTPDDLLNAIKSLQIIGQSNEHQG